MHAIGVGIGVLAWWLAGWAVSELFRIQAAGPTLGSPLLLTSGVVIVAFSLTGFLRMIGGLAAAGATVLMLWALGWILLSIEADLGWELKVRAGDVLVPAVGAIWLAMSVKPERLRRELVPRGEEAASPDSMAGSEDGGSEGFH